MKDSEATGLEMNAKGVDKGTGLKQLCHHLGISIEETIVVGDADNDKEALEVAGLSIAIGMGVSLSNACLNQMTSTIYDGLGMTMGLENFQSIINNTFASSPVVLATIFAVILNLVLPKDPKPEAK